MMIKKKVILFFSLLYFENFPLSRGQDDYIPIVQLPKGKIKGHILKSYQGNEYYAFQEIPYAAPPVGENRFKIPKESDSWSELLDATKNTVICSQFPQFPNLTNSEDCLYLNVYTPLKPGSNESLLPVVVWIHPGSFVTMSGTYEHYGPQYIMDSDVVVVTFNYRLGPFGFLTTEDEVIPANLGLKDQQFALQWVSDNIELFGGNSSHVTVMGQDVGAAAIGLHLLGPWPAGKELFHAAVLQSGNPMALALMDDAKEIALEVAKYIDPNFTSEESADILAVLQQASTEQILEPTTIYNVVLEKEGSFSYPMLQALIDGNFKRVQLLIGITSEESALNYHFLKPLYDQVIDVIDDSLEDLLPEKLTVTNATLVGQQLKEIYTNVSFKEDIGAFIRIMSDTSFATPSLKFAELYSKYCDVYFYKFSYKGELGMQMFLSQIPNSESVGHAEDLNYMWDNQTNSDLSQFPESDQLTLHRFVKLWTNFIKYYNPTPSDDDDLLQRILWPKIDPEELNTIPYLDLNSNLEIRYNPRQYQEVKKVLDDNILPPYIVY